MPNPYRVLLLGAATTGWYGATDRQRQQQILPAFTELLDRWRQAGARLLTTLDDDLFSVGDHDRPGWFLMFEVDQLEIVVGMLQAVRETINGVRMDEYVRFEARVGRPFFLLEQSTAAASAD